MKSQIDARREAVQRLVPIITMVVLAIAVGCGKKGGQADSPVAGISKPTNSGIPNQLEFAKLQDMIIGEWIWTGSFEGKEITIWNNFTKDGVVKVLQGGVPMDVKYRIVDENQIDYGLYGRSKIISITKAKLDIIGNDGVRRTWTRP